jgi:hypothetical protein
LHNFGIVQSAQEEDFRVGNKLAELSSGFDTATLELLAGYRDLCCSPRPAVSFASSQADESQLSLT